ncbi:unnamed protein product [Rhizoctonia solani]|uniref:Meiotically up-regulated gene 158 protein n=1 Tax=Rhizoctonia solani TaxID=456999 RepID=A0A8H3B2D5_9AGAM|nr:unnamed protein product [Rhizoctonia solani]
MTSTMDPLIVDVRENASGDNSPSNTVIDAIIEGLSKPSGARSLPTLLLYNERGLRLYDDITTKATEYYLFGCEEQILSDHADEIIVRAMGAAQRDHEVVIELGAGALRKTSHFLLALARAAKPANTGEKPRSSYYALDLERAELVRTLRELSAGIGKDLDGRVSFGGMWGTYDGGIAFVKRGGLRELQLKQEISSKLEDLETERGRAVDRVPVVRTAQPTPTPSESNSGSSPQEEAMTAPVVATVTGSATQTPNRSALPTPPSSLPSPTEKPVSTPIQLLFLGSSIGNFTPDGAVDFLRSLPLRAGSGDTLLLGLDGKNDPDLVKLAYDDPQGYTRAFALNGIKHAEKITGGLIDSNKWGYLEKYNATIGRHEGYYRSSVKQTIKLPMSDAHPRGDTVELDEGELVNFEYSYKSWDAITIGMIPQEMLHQKPIDLRHKCLFYLGHIPAFLDIHLTNLLGEKHTEPEYFKHIFERGIDPHVDDPTQIHPHSEVPEKDEDWPSLKEILSFRDRVRARLMKLYDDFESGKRVLTRTIGRVLWMTFEHETFHAETLLYMLLQRAGSGTIPPATTVPDWETLAKVWDAEVHATLNAPALVRIGPSEVTVGHDDFESEDALAPEGWHSSYEFGWDNEHPKRSVSIGSVDISTRPVTNGDYHAFLSKQSRLGENDLPASWVRLNDEIRVRTLYGLVDFDVAKHWPLVASYDQIADYARAQGGRLPTHAELLAFRDQCDGTSMGQGNFGFRNWHYIPPRPSTREERGHNGGIWEWTSTLMYAHEGHVPSIRYPGYSSDFHDQKHHIVIGGSLMQLYDDFESGKRVLTRTIGRVLWMTYEHEVLHAETLLYMLVQRGGSGTIPPATIIPDWEMLAKVWDAEVRATSNAPTLVRIGPSEVTVGHDDFEAEDASAPEGWQSSYEFGWDNEHPKRSVSIGSVDISARPITNSDYLAFLSKQSRLGEKDLPASWVRVQDEIRVRTLYGPVGFDVAKHWPLAASYDEIAGYARAQGGRLPTDAELIAFRDLCDGTSVGQGNFGYQNWHYIPPHPSTREERGHNGGVWEWTSTLMHVHEGYVPSIRYPGYSSDFHDQKHHIVLGGSFATIPRLAMRRSFVNFYQHNYAYAWIGGRICFDT